MRKGVLASAVAVVATSTALATAPVPTRFVRSEATAPRVPLLIGHPDESARMTVTFALRMRGRRIDAYLRRAYDPSSASYRHFVSPEQFGRRFGISRDSLAAVERSLTRAGLRVVDTYAQRTAIDVSGTVGEVESLLDTRIAIYLDVDGRRYHAPVNPPVIPRAIRSAVIGVSGLSDRARPVPLDIPAAGMRPGDLAAAYDIKPLWEAGVRGQGQTVAIYSGASFEDSDPAEFARRFGITGPPPEHVPVQGGTKDRTSDLTDEVNLDIDVVRAVAPGAQVLNYEVPNGGIIRGLPRGLATGINRIVEDGRADIVSVSHGICDVPTLVGKPMLPPGERAAAENAFRAAAASGISIFVGSGDGGAYGCQHIYPPDVRVTPTWPGDSPYVISVGGTYLSVRRDGSYLDEAGWENPLSRWGSGGGMNPYSRRPAWQRAPGVFVAGVSNGKRQFPDVAATADGASGYRAVSGGKLWRFRGTSGSAPFWAGVMVLVQQYATKLGGERLGFIAPLLYRLAREEQPYPPYHDVTNGGNLYYDCKPGWDFATGLGSPDAYNLARDVVAMQLNRR